MNSEPVPLGGPEANNEGVRTDTASADLIEISLSRNDHLELIKVDLPEVPSNPYLIPCAEDGTPTKVTAPDSPLASISCVVSADGDVTSTVINYKREAWDWPGLLSGLYQRITFTGFSRYWMLSSIFSFPSWLLCIKENIYYNQRTSPSTDFTLRPIFRFWRNGGP
ncbi:hypothetical protein BC829DRAFT_77148 [Chytridium lagenaria]|nr:hypothetical protein BC829DRAFT_77148 [Chytridium lagenaria]